MSDLRLASDDAPRTHVSELVETIRNDLTRDEYIAFGVYHRPQNFRPKVSAAAASAIAELGIEQKFVPAPPKAKVTLPPQLRSRPVAPQRAP